jgi:hypothetical protein
MKLNLERRWLTEHSTIGVLDIDGEFFGFSLEDRMREPGVKVPGKTCIPEGTYPVILSWSPKNQRIMPRLLNVPNFTGILIHPGNTEDDTLGCILVGYKYQTDKITESRLAFNALFDKLRFATLSGEVISITISLDTQVKFVA